MLASLLLATLLAQDLPPRQVYCVGDNCTDLTRSSTTVLPADPAWLHGAIAAAVTASMTDLAVTEYGLGSGALRELNPVLRQGGPVSTGIVKGATTASSALLLLKLHKTHPKIALIFALGETAFYSWATYHNYQLLKNSGIKIASTSGYD